jgi:S-adenosylmethionine decarboxylase
MIKTCGTTTLLNCIPKLLEFAAMLDLSVELVMYSRYYCFQASAYPSRKNFLFPHKQIYPHMNWSDEVEFMNKIFDGTAYVLGPLTQSHWYLYIADYSEHRGTEDEHEMTMEIMMHDLDPVAASRFYRREGITDDAKFPGVADLLPGSETDEFNFTPCGYSMNGLSNEAYYTIHVTPEPHCSYASFETNVTLTSYVKLISNVCEIFKPGSLTITLFNENGQTDHTYCRQEHVNLNIPGYFTLPFYLKYCSYTLKHKTFCELEGCIDVTLCNFKISNTAAGKTRRSPPKLPLQLLNDEQS